jgi:hypothetical protein
VSGGVEEKNDAWSAFNVPSTVNEYVLASTVVPGSRVSVTPWSTVTFPSRTTVPDQVVFTVTVLSAAGTIGTQAMVTIKEMRRKAGRLRMSLR